MSAHVNQNNLELFWVDRDGTVTDRDRPWRTVTDRDECLKQFTFLPLIGKSPWRTVTDRDWLWQPKIVAICGKVWRWGSTPAQCRNKIIIRNKITCISQVCAWCWVRSWCWGDQRSTCCTIDVCLVWCCGERWALLIAERGHIYLQIWHDFLEELQPAWGTISTEWLTTLEVSSEATCVPSPVGRHAAYKAKLQTSQLFSWWGPYGSSETFGM